MRLAIEVALFWIALFFLLNCAVIKHSKAVCCTSTSSNRWRACFIFSQPQVTYHTSLFLNLLCLLTSEYLLKNTSLLFLLPFFVFQRRNAEGGDLQWISIPAKGNRFNLSCRWEKLWLCVPFASVQDVTIRSCQATVEFSGIKITLTDTAFNDVFFLCLFVFLFIFIITFSGTA